MRLGNRLTKIKSLIKLFNTQKLIYTSNRHYTARRALLYVPGDDNRKLQKALSLEVDCIGMDCEDGVALNRKDIARTTIFSLLDCCQVSQSQPEWAIRVNSVESGICKSDLETLLSAKSLPPTILLPKVDKPEHLQWFGEEIQKHISKRASDVKINLVIFIESAQAIMNLPKICQAAEDLSLKYRFVPVALLFGSDDLLASLGASRSSDGSEIMYARQRLLLVAKAFKWQAIDMVYIQYKDLKGLQEQCKIGASLGFTGKQVIHPDQVPIVQRAFLPTKEMLQWAEGVINSFNEHQKKGKGAFVYNGSMIDMPLLKQAQNIIALSKSA